MVFAIKLIEKPFWDYKLVSFIEHDVHNTGVILLASFTDFNLYILGPTPITRNSVWLIFFSPARIYKKSVRVEFMYSWVSCKLVILNCDIYYVLHFRSQLPATCNYSILLLFIQFMLYPTTQTSDACYGIQKQLTIVNGSRSSLPHNIMIPNADWHIAGTTDTNENKQIIMIPITRNVMFHDYTFVMKPSQLYPDCPRAAVLSSSSSFPSCQIQQRTITSNLTIQN